MLSRLDLWGRLRRWRPEDRWACLGAYALLLAWCLPLLVGTDTRGSPVYVDWEWFLSYYQVLRTTLVEHLQFPGFNPYMYLGSPLWANPQLGPISHFTPLVLLFGALYGMKLGFVVSFLIAFEAARALGRELFDSPLAAVIAGLLYALNTGLASHLIIGHGCFTAYCLAPLLVLYCLRLTSHPWSGAMAGAVAGLMVHYGIHYYMTHALAMCGLLTLCLGISRRAWRALFRFGLQFGLALVLVSAIRLVPILELMADFPRKLSVPYGVNAQALWQMFFVPALDPMAFKLTIVSERIMYHLIAGEFHAYAGMLALLVALLSLRWGVRFFHVGVLLSLLLLLGTDQPWHLSRWLGAVPPFDSMWVVTRWRVVLLACLAFAAGQGIDRILAWCRTRQTPAAPRLAAVLAWALPLELIILLMPAWAAVITPHRELPMDRGQLGIPHTEHMIAVRQIQRVWRGEKSTAYHAMFGANLGAANGYEPLFGYLPARSARTFVGHPAYRGEFSVDGREVRPVRWSPNRVRLEGLTPGASLEVNLNPGRGWSLNGEDIFAGYRLFELQRRFVVKVPASGMVELSYTPPGLAAGAWATVGAGLLLLAWIRLERRRAEIPV